MYFIGIVSIENGAFNTKLNENSLESIDLSKNHLVRLDAEVLAGLKRLRRLNLAYNHLSFSEKNFENNDKLQSIDLSNNNIQYLPSHLFSGLNDLESVCSIIYKFLVSLSLK